MIIITPEAAKQIRYSAEATESKDLYLRIAVRRGEDGTYLYGMGFDEMSDDDALLASEGVSVLVANSVKDFLMGARLDYVDINPGERQFILSNPNDPAHAKTAGPSQNPDNPTKNG